MNDTLDYELAKIIASDILTSSGAMAQRIALKGGEYPDNEIDLGGLGKSALIEVITQSIQNAFGYTGN